MANVQEQITQAKAAGYSDADIAKHLGSMQDFAPKIKTAMDAGYKPEDIIAHLSAAAKPAKPFGQQMNEGIADIPRQVGLTARHGLNAAGNVVGMLSDPIGGVINAVTGSKLQTARSLTDKVSDAIGLPKPANSTERWVGDAAEMMGTGGGTVGLASKAATTASGAGKVLAQTLAANPLQQVASSGAAGAAGGYTREEGGNAGSQFVASLAAGIAAPAAINAGQKLVSSAGNAIQRMTTPAAAQTAQIDIKIDRALQDSGIKFSDLQPNIQAGLRADVAKALEASDNLSPAAVRRLADYRLTDTTPTAATLSLDPAAVSQQKNLAKLGINSKDVNAQRLGQVENSNNNQLISRLNDLGAGTRDDALAGGEKVMNALAARNDRAKTLIDGRYAAARATDGRSAALDPYAFTQQANNQLDEALLGGKLPSDVRNLLNKAATGDMPLTVDVAEQFKTRIGALQRASTDPAERMALGLVRRSLDDTPLLDGQGEGAIKAFNQARKLNKAWMDIVERTPALQAVRDGVEPDKFVQKFIVGNGEKANVADLDALYKSVRSSPEAMAAVKEQIAAHLKQKAINGAADEVGNLSQSAYNKALNAIGERKLSMFFKPDEVDQLKAIGRVASYEQFQPKGSAVGNSNTAAAGLSAVFDRIANSPLLNKIPFGNQLAGPAQNISVGIKSNQALNIPAALAGNKLLPKKDAGLMISPAMFGMPDDRERKNSLLP